MIDWRYLEPEVVQATAAKFEESSKPAVDLIVISGGVANGKLEISVGVAAARLEASGELGELTNDKFEISVEAAAVMLELSGKTVPAL